MKEIVNIVSKIKKSIPEFECDPELKKIIEKILSLCDNEELQNKRRKNSKNFIIKHMTKTLPNGEKCEALKRIITKLFDKF